jgi:hypothetical protein
LLIGWFVYISIKTARGRFFALSEESFRQKNKNRESRHRRFTRFIYKKDNKTCPCLRKNLPCCLPDIVILAYAFRAIPLRA